MMLCTAAVLAQLAKLQPAGAPHAPDCIRYSARTVLATLVTDAELDIHTLVAFRIDAGGKLRRVSGSEREVRNVQARDMDHDGVPEILASEYPGNRATAIDVLHWTGAKFVEVGAFNTSSSFVDLDHDGIDEVISHGCCDRNENDCVVGHAHVQRWRNGALVRDTSRNIAAVLIVTKQHAGAAETYEMHPYLSDVESKSCQLHIVNGTCGGKHRARSLTMQLRPIESDTQPGKLVRTTLTAAREYVDMPLTLPSRCTAMDVTLTGGRARRSRSSSRPAASDVERAGRPAPAQVSSR